MNEAPQLGGIGVGDNALDDAKAFNKGKGKLLAAMIAIVVLALGGFAWYLVQDQPNPYGELGKQVNGLRSQDFDGFWTCALPGTRPSELKSDADLRGALNERSSAASRYAAHLRGKCAPMLRDLGTRLRALLPPEDAAPKVKELANAVTKMEVGVNSYCAYLENLEGAFAASAAESEQQELARGWYEFRKTHAELNQLIKDKLGR